MEEKYWEQFLVSGKVTDYLYYRGFSILNQVMEKHRKAPAEGEISESGDGYGGSDFGFPYRRI